MHCGLLRYNLKSGCALGSGTQISHQQRKGTQLSGCSGQLKTLQPRLMGSANVHVLCILFPTYMVLSAASSWKSSPMPVPGRLKTHRGATDMYTYSGVCLHRKGPGRNNMKNGIRKDLWGSGWDLYYYLIPLLTLEYF